MFCSAGLDDALYREYEHGYAAYWFECISTYACDGSGVFVNYQDYLEMAANYGISGAGALAPIWFYDCVANDGSCAGIFSQNVMVPVCLFPTQNDGEIVEVVLRLGSDFRSCILRADDAFSINTFFNYADGSIARFNLARRTNKAVFDLDYFLEKYQWIWCDFYNDHTNVAVSISTLVKKIKTNYQTFRVKGKTLNEAFNGKRNVFTSPINFEQQKALFIRTFINFNQVQSNILII